MNRRSTLLAVVGAASVALVLGGCAGAGSGTARGATADSGAAGATAGYPVTLDNCGTTVIVAAAPKRIVTIKSSTTELLLALGLGDRIVGSAFLDGPLPASLATAGKGLNVVSDFVPGQEAVLALTPDFVYGGWESNFTADGVGERGQLDGLGIGSYVSPAACKGSGYMPDPLTFDSVFAEITEAGAIFGRADAADRLVKTQEKALAGLAPDVVMPTLAALGATQSSPYFIATRARDSAGRWSSLLEKQITVVADQLPTVSIASPLQGSAAVRGQFVDVHVFAQDVDVARRAPARLRVRRRGQARYAHGSLRHRRRGNHRLQLRAAG